jgi:predicted molibdopterin-dependent oxidoreductase YjgC
VLPIAAWSEEEGTYTNFAGVVQHAARALPPPGEARPALQVLAELLAQAGRSLHQVTPARVFAEVVREVPQYEGLAYAELESRKATAYPPKGRFAYGQGGFAGY